MMRAAGLPRYQRLPVPPELVAETVRALPAAGFAGANVTIPHKEAVAALADERSAAAASLCGIVTFAPANPAAGSARTVSANSSGGTGRRW